MIRARIFLSMDVCFWRHVYATELVILLRNYCVYSNILQNPNILPNLTQHKLRANILPCPIEDDRNVLDNG